MLETEGRLDSEDRVSCRDGVGAEDAEIAGVGLVKRGCKTRAGACSHRALRFGLGFRVTRHALEPSNKDGRGALD